MFLSTFLSHRDIRQHEEVTLRYNDPAESLMEVHDMIGGCFYADRCECGSLFCHGDMLRRVAAGWVLESDCFFFGDVGGQLLVNVDLIQHANAVARSRFGVSEKATAALSESARMDVMKSLESTQRLAKMHPSDVVNLFHRSVNVDELTLDELEIMIEDEVIGRP